ncbi:MAG: hypothetical protein HYR71_03800, partial [Chloroflexi bacterium]|nr:hypothetical protein [Chloroflexota bacterium]
MNPRAIDGAEPPGGVEGRRPSIGFLKGRARYRSALKAVMALALAVFLVLLTIVDQYGWVDRAQPADAIVLLGSMVYPGG